MTSLHADVNTFSDQRYTGLTDDLKVRLAKHNEGGSPHTSKYKPWKLVAFPKFEDNIRAAAFQSICQQALMVRAKALAVLHLELSVSLTVKGHGKSPVEYTSSALQ